MTTRNDDKQKTAPRDSGTAGCAPRGAFEFGRRDFFSKGLLAAAGAFVAFRKAKAGGIASPSAPLASRPCCAAAQPNLTAALLPNGTLVQVESDAHVHAARPPSDANVRAGAPGRKWVMVIDLAKCDGCKKCTEACQKMHMTPSDREWIRVFQMKEGEQTAPYFMPKPCFHCDNPPCTKVCPVGATFKRQDGIVLIDNQRCIGCRFCIAACPYSTRYFNWSRPPNPLEAQQANYSPETGYPRRVGTAEKCDFCPEMLEAGQLPHCASNCAMGALYFGDQNEDAVTNFAGETERLSKLLKDRAGYRFMEELGTAPRVYYLPPKNRKYPAPGESPKA